MENFLLSILDGEDKSSPLKNRIRKNYQHLRKWAKRTETNCFRIYDRDIKEYPVAIDYYAGRMCVHYFTYDDDITDLKKATLSAIDSLFGSPAIFERSRIKREKLEQYEKSGSKKEFFTVQEYGVLFKVNLVDYLDTGLFLDHRETRRRVALQSKGLRLLNLFAYTCSFGVHAAMQGAAFTKNVDLSNTYTAWGRENYNLNHLPAHQNEIIRADCLHFLQETTEKYDIIVMDPPTLSRSKKMEKMFDVQKDYIPLLTKALPLLNANGHLFFSTNLRTFSFDPTPFPLYSIEEITHKTLPADFHNRKIHRCWQFTKARR